MKTGSRLTEICVRFGSMDSFWRYDQMSTNLFHAI